VARQLAVEENVKFNNKRVGLGLPFNLKPNTMNIEELALDVYPIEKDPSEEAKNALLRIGFKKGWMIATENTKG
jgi:hypothetical protein